MNASVKPEFPRRQKRAQATRRAILDAAGELFIEQGYAATTIQAIADRADVAVQTVYAVYGNKRAILDAVLDVTIAGDDAEIAVNAREWMRPVFEAPTATARLRAYAAAVRQIMARAGDLLVVVGAAARTDPEIVPLAEQTEQRRRMGAVAVVESVARVGRLRSGLTTERAVDLLWLFNGPAVFDQLVRRAGWSLDDYETWLAATLCEQLLGRRPGVRS